MGGIWHGRGTIHKAVIEFQHSLAARTIAIMAAARTQLICVNRETLDNVRFPFYQLLHTRYEKINKKSVLGKSENRRFQTDSLDRNAWVGN